MYLTEENYRDLSDPSELIAIVGMSLRVPGADTLESFWQNLRNGRETITFFTDDELRNAGVDETTLSSPNYVKAMGRLEDVEMFDARFFDMTPKEAEILDPQHRVLMEGVWRALEDAAIDSERYPGRIGLYAGVGFNGYLIHHILSRPDLLESAGAWQLSLNNDKDFAPTRIAYKFNLQGPAVSVNTACSSSLVSTVMAAQSLLAYQCDTAIAGGCSIHLPQDEGYHFMTGGTVSPDGHCRPFDEDAAGTVDGNGTAVVVLKRLKDAVSDGDSIHALLRGFAINNDGSLKVGYTAPSVSGQSDVIMEALEMAELDASEIQFIETHGTGTELGDSVEISALSEAFRETGGGKASCAIGSVKSNFGHLDTAAGVAGLIKTVLAMQHSEIPPTCHFNKPNPKLGLEKGPFYVNKKGIPWPETGDSPRVAGVSSFGIGGTNAHVIVEEVIQDHANSSTEVEGQTYVLLPLAAKTEDALKQIASELAHHIESNPDQSLTDIAWTLQVGRRHFAFRNFVIVGVNDRVECCRILKEIDGIYDLDNPTDSTNESQDRSAIEDLIAIGRLWIEGSGIKWEETFGKHLRASIPGHPFKRERYWIDRPVGLPALSSLNGESLSGINGSGTTNSAVSVQERRLDVRDDLTGAIAKESLIDNWFYLPGVRRILPSVERVPKGSRWLIFKDAFGLAKKVSDALREVGAEAILVDHKEMNSASMLTGSATDGFILDTTVEASWDRLFSKLGEWKPDQILHFGLYEEIHAQSDDFASKTDASKPEMDSSGDEQSKSKSSAMQHLAFDGLIALGQAMGHHFFSDETGITLLANGILSSGEIGTAEPPKVTALGPLRVIPQEYPNLTTRVIDITENVRLSLILSEIADKNGPASVFLKGGNRWIEEYEPVAIPDSAGYSTASDSIEGLDDEQKNLPTKKGDLIPVRLQNNGVYLITGGLGNIGLAIANYLAKTVSARLILTGRSKFPERSNWEKLLKDANTPLHLQKQIRRLLEVEAAGGDIMICEADVSELKEMEKVFSLVENKYGELNGVIHAAGLVGEQSFVTLNDARDDSGKEANRRQFPPKTEGTEVLRQLLSDRSFDFCLICSSLSPLLGGLGFSAYAATNLYADALVEKCNLSQPGKWIGVNWEGWVFEEDILPGNTATSSAFELGMTPEEGVEVFARLMDLSHLDRIIISSGNLRRRLSQWTGKRTESDSVESGESHARPEYIGPYTPPSTDTEQQLVGLWGKLLGIEGIGIHDSFFELGGNSLLLTQLVAMIRRTFRTELALSAMFEKPTVAAMAAQIDGTRKDSSKMEEREEGFL